MQSILSARLVPGLGHRLAAHRAYDLQQTLKAAQATRLDNLLEPVAGAFGVRGRFDGTARTASAHWWLSARRWKVAAVAGVVLDAAAVAVMMRLERN